MSLDSRRAEYHGRQRRNVIKRAYRGVMLYVDPVADSLASAIVSAVVLALTVSLKRLGSLNAGS
jgi:hypothetical protein